MIEEFVEYYRNISCGIDSDEYFALMINNSWNVNAKPSTYQRPVKAATEQDNMSVASEDLEYRREY